MKTRAVVVALALASFALAQTDGKRIADLEATVRDASREATARVAALSALQGARDLDSAVLAEALSSGVPTLSACAAAILRHEWLQWPSEILDAANASTSGMRALMQELALAPRPSLASWVEGACRNDDPSVRALALAARVAPPSREEASWLLARLAADDDRTPSLAVQRIEAAVADRLVGELHGHLAGGAVPSRVVEFCDRLSPKGLEQLVGVASTLEVEVAAPFLDLLALRKSPALQETMRAMVDGEIPADPVLVRRAGSLLTDEDRRARASAWMRSAVEAPRDERAQALGLAAFEAALDANHVDDAALAFARAGGESRLRRLLDGGAEWPEGVGDADDGSWLLVVKALARRGIPLPADLDARARVFLDERLADAAAQSDLRVVTQALARLANESALPLLVRACAKDAECARAAVDALLDRKDPVGAVMLESLLADLRATGAEGYAPAADVVDLVQLERGTRNSDDARFDALFERLAQCKPRTIERIASACPQLSDARWRQVLAAFDAATGTAKERISRHLTMCPLDDAVVALRRAHAAETDTDLKLSFYERRLRTKDRTELVASGRGAFGVDVDRDDDFVFAVLATMGKPLADADLQFLDWLMFDAPGKDPREASRAKDPRSRGAFPESAAVANVLLRDPDNGARAFTSAASRVANAASLGGSRRRYVELWEALQRDAVLLDRIGRATASFVLAIPDASLRGEAAASLYAAREASARGEHEEAGRRYGRAIAGLLRDPEDESEARIHLGVRAPLEGHDPHAALAAQPFLCRARAATDPAQARAALAIAAELAGRDRGALEAIDAILKTLR